MSSAQPNPHDCSQESGTVRSDGQRRLAEICGHLTGVTTASQTQFNARCPAHDDRNPSLSLGLQEDGRVLIHCHAGCEFDSVVEALGLEPTDLSPGTPLVEAEYDYQDEAGQTVFQVRRYRGKQFSARRPDGEGGWVENAGDARRVPYRLQEVLAAAARSGRIYVAEGEKDVEALRGLGLVATTNPFGAGKWKPEFSPHLAGAEVVVIPDADMTGRKHAAAVCRSILPYAKSVRLIELPDARDGEDASDFVIKGWVRDDFDRCADTAPEFSVPDPEPASSAGSSPTEEPLESENSKAGPSTSMKVIDIAELMAMPDVEPEFLVEGLLLKRGTSLWVGKPKAGKTTAARCSAAAVASGEDFLDRKVQKGGVLYLSLEDSEELVRSHFRALGCDSGIKFFFGMPPPDPIRALSRLLAEHRPGLVIVDTLAKLVRLRDFKDYGEVSRIMQQFQALAREFGCHVMLIHHAPKIGGEGIDAPIGSVGFVGGVDTLVVLTEKRGQRTVASRQRYGGDLESAMLTFDNVTRRVGLGVPVEVAEEARLRTEILDSLPSSAPGKTETELFKEVAGDTGAKSKILRTLVKEGLVLREGKGVRNSPFSYSRSIRV